MSRYSRCRTHCHYWKISEIKARLQWKQILCNSNHTNTRRQNVSFPTFKSSFNCDASKSVNCDMSWTIFCIFSGYTLLDPSHLGRATSAENTLDVKNGPRVNNLIGQWNVLCLAETVPVHKNYLYLYKLPEESIQNSRYMHKRHVHFSHTKA